MKYIVFILLFIVTYSSTQAQDSLGIDKSVILELRLKSNLALKNHQIENVLGYLTDDINIAASNGKIFSGKEDFRAALIDIFNTYPDLYFVRNSEEVILNIENNVAWEKGYWISLRPETTDWITYGGKYSAYWVKNDGMWKIKSELFVRLD